MNRYLYKKKKLLLRLLGDENPNSNQAQPQQPKNPKSKFNQMNNSIQLQKDKHKKM